MMRFGAAMPVHGSKSGKIKYWLNSAIIALSVMLSLNALSCRQDREQIEITTLDGYKESVLKMRKEKDEYLRTADDSPIPADRRKAFTGLKYFEPSEHYIVEAKLMPFPKQDTIQMLTTKKNDIRKMLRYAQFVFSLDSREYKLTAYVSLPAGRSNSLFVPFVDATCGKDSYSGGRYLDIEEIKGAGTYTLDFNFCYNPYCAYNKKYSCPVVPMENIINASIRAGERNYGKGH
ncbi:MAG TPA: DUF1684 domain-containing protein [Ignavibacteriales bacterium]|nr:DUF1684 domain-containing protein [Ignavibacteriales bacterium]